MLPPINFLGWRALRAKENLKSMEQCLRAKAGKYRLFSAALFHDCSMRHERGGPLFTTESPATAGKLRHGAGISPKVDRGGQPAVIH
jgi:hypothetical protein